MKKYGLFLLLPLFLSMTTSSKLHLSRKIVGHWMFYIHGTFGKPETFCNWEKVKVEGNEYDGFEFKKNKELIVSYDLFHGCPMGPPEYIKLHGVWTETNDSTVHIDYMDDTAKVSRNFILFKNSRGELNLKLKD